jgi:DNA-binding MarR family transcriptional regulator
MFASYHRCMATSATAGQARRLVHGLAGAWRRVEARAAPAVAASTGLDLDDFVFLETIAMTDLSPGEIAAALRIPAHGVSRRLAALEGAGLVRRSLDPDDARRRVLTVTPHGRSTLTDAHAALEARVAPMLQRTGRGAQPRAARRPDAAGGRRRPRRRARPPRVPRRRHAPVGGAAG